MKEISLQVSSLDPRFVIFIDLCSCDFQAAESFTVQVNENYGSLDYMYITINFSHVVCFVL